MSTEFHLIPIIGFDIDLYVLFLKIPSDLHVAVVGWDERFSILIHKNSWLWYATSFSAAFG